MQYENFSRHLRQKYRTRLHVADQLVDQLKDKNQTRISSTSLHELNNKNMIIAQREISFPLISYLNDIECDVQESIENKQFEPYFNECLIAAERIKNNRRSDRDRQICYENLILAQKLERIKKQPGQNARVNLEKDYRNHCRLLLSKANCEHNALKLINKNFTTKQSSSTEKTLHSDEEKCSINPHHSSLSIESENESSSSEIEDDQATAADVDASIEYGDSKPSASRKILRRKQRNNRNFNYAPSLVAKCKEIDPSKNHNQRFFEKENNRVYQHLNNIDMTMVRDTIPLSTFQAPRHFSVCILPRFDSDATKPMSKQSKDLSSHDRKYAFKKEILYQ